MAFTANTAFEARLTNNALDTLANVAGKFGSFSGETFTAADCSAGFLCKASGKLPCEGFSGVYNENAYYMVAAANTDTANVVIYACDTHDNQLIGNGGNNYFVGTETLGLGVPANRYGNFCQIMFDNRSKYRFGVGNLSTAVGSNEYFTIAAGQLVPAATAPTAVGAIYFKLEGTGTFVEGTAASFGYVDVTACVNLVAPAPAG